MPANEKIAKIDPNGGPLTIEVIIGHAQRGEYYLFLWDPTGQNSTDIGHGFSFDNLPDVWSIPNTPNTLNDHALTWEVTVSASHNAPGQLYSVGVRIMQGGNTVPGGEVFDSGSLDGTKGVWDYVRFVI